MAAHVLQIVPGMLAGLLLGSMLGIPGWRLARLISIAPRHAVSVVL